MRTRLVGTLVSIVVLHGLGLRAGADETFYRVALGDLKVEGGELPAEGAPEDWAGRSRWDTLRPYAVLDGEGDALIAPAGARGGDWVRPTLRGSVLLVRTPRGGNVGGTVYLPDAKAGRLVPRLFTIGAAAASAEARQDYYGGREWHYERLLSQNVPGGAWFRHQARAARLQIDPLAPDRGTAAQRARGTRPGELADTYALLGGGRALSENLQLDRALPPRDPKLEGDVVALASLRGIATQPIDWKAKLDATAKAGAGDAQSGPPRDPLAKLIPHDQHALFFPTFDAMVALADEADRYGTLALHAVEPRSEDGRTRARYERQLCLSLTGLGRLVGPHVVKSVAVTGSDPYLRIGSDVAVVFESRGAGAALEELLLAQVALGRQREPAAKAVEGEMAGGVRYSGAASPDRAVSCYVASLGDAVVVTNSKAQLERLAAVKQGRVPSLDSLDEYAFFRGRYRRGREDETAFLVLTDATIRRWCGPRWRIADSRRTRVAALLAEVQAEHLDTLVKGQVTAENRPHVDLYVQDMGEIRLTPRGATSAVYGSLEFMTPILELPLDQISGAEARAYARWRDDYESNWRQYFDPIAARLSLGKDGSLSADMTVMPLIKQTSYRPLISVTRDAALPPTAGDPHDEALVHVALAANPKSPTVTLGAAFLANVLPGDREELLGAVGPGLAVYADDDPYWAELMRAKDPGAFLLNNLGRAPVALHIELSDAARMSTFLAGAKDAAEQTYPGLARWETLEHNGQAYVRITATEQAIAEQPRLKGAALCYANTGKSLVLTPREDLVRRAIDRLKAPAGNGNGAQWLGSSSGLRLQPRAWDVLRQGLSQPYRQIMRRRAWDNLPVLNEWKRLYPDRNPVEVHERLWQTRLVDPGGGQYVWNEKFRTMESTTYGHPGAPKDGPETPPVLASLVAAHFGLTFEEDGLRAKAKVERKSPAE
jgi:hypothetical protein